MSDRWATFDCYGTLIDWMGGIRAALADVWPDADADHLLRRYHEIEPAIQADRGIPYAQVMAEALAELAHGEGRGVPPGRQDALGVSLPSWPPFPETRAALTELRRRGWRIGILSNTDPEYLEASFRLIDVPTDIRIVASEIGSYKPTLAHWDAFFSRTRADRARHVHVGASLFHDVEPSAALGLPCVWINRERETSDLPRAAELTDLTALADTLETIVPS